MATQYRLPYGLSFAPGGKLKPGRGEAGWTVVTLPSVKAVIEFMEDFPHAEMPAWKRLRRNGKPDADCIKRLCAHK